jgi:hypothetical protein
MQNQKRKKRDSGWDGYGVSRNVVGKFSKYGKYRVQTIMEKFTLVERHQSIPRIYRLPTTSRKDNGKWMRTS